MALAQRPSRRTPLEGNHRGHRISQGCHTTQGGESGEGGEGGEGGYSDRGVGGGAEWIEQPLLFV